MSAAAGTAPKGGPDAGATGMRSGRRDMAIWSWPGFGRSGTSPGREVPGAERDAGAGGAARERRGSGDRRAPVLRSLRPLGLSIIKSRAEPSRAEPSRAEPSRAEPRSRRSSEPSSVAPAGARHSENPRPHQRAPGAPGRPDSPCASRPGALRALAMLLLTCAALLGSGTLARADVLVSNLEQSTSGFLQITFFAVAQGFTTGSNSAGYILTSVEVGFGLVSGMVSVDNLTVVLRPESSGAPGTDGVTLINPPSLSAHSAATFTAPAGTTLSASTKYYVVLSYTDSESNRQVQLVPTEISVKRIRPSPDGTSTTVTCIALPELRMTGVPCSNWPYGSKLTARNPRNPRNRTRRRTSRRHRATGR